MFDVFVLVLSLTPFVLSFVVSSFSSGFITAAGAFAITIFTVSPDDTLSPIFFVCEMIVFSE